MSDEHGKNGSLDDPLSAELRKWLLKDLVGEDVLSTQILLANYAARRRARLYLKAIQWNTTVDEIKKREQVHGDIH